MANMARWCCCGCTIPALAEGFSQNNQGSVSGMTGSATCVSRNGVVYPRDYVDGPDYWYWTWGLGSPTGTPTVRIWRAKTATTISRGGSCSLAFAACEWAVEVIGFNATWFEKTSGFSINGPTGSIFGNHTFLAGPCKTSSGCGGTPGVGITA
jgi:hypothetical protein